MGKWAFSGDFAARFPVLGGAGMWLLVSMLFFDAGLLAAPQETTQSPAAGTHKAKVWTNEELISTRTPADMYIFNKESEAAARESAELNNILSCFAFNQADGTAEETQKEIDSAVQSIRDSEGAVAQSRKALKSGPDNLKLRNQMELAQRTAELNHARERLWKLQDHLRELQAQPPATQNAPVPPPAPSQ